MPRPAVTPKPLLLLVQAPLLCLALSACGLIPQENTALSQRSSNLQTAELTQGQRRFGDAIYTGELRGNQPDGEGTLEWDDGRTYQGPFSFGQMQGQGLLTLPDGSYYEGPFHGDRPFGQGTLTLTDDRRLTGNFTGLDAVNGQMVMADGSRLEGHFKDLKLNGQGTWLKPDGEQLSGQYRNGDAFGLMQLTVKDQPTRQQLWHEGERLMGHLANPTDFGRDPQAMGREIIASYQWHADQLPAPITQQTLEYSAALLEDPLLSYTPEQQIDVLGHWPQLAGAMTSLPYEKRLQELAKESDCSGFATAISLFPDRYTPQLQQACSDIAREKGASAADYAYLLDNQLVTSQQVPEHHHPLLSGPRGARPVELLAQLELGANANQLATLVASGSSAYPLVYGHNEQLLREAGVPFSLISAMQSANQRYFNEQEELRRYREEQQRINREMAQEQRRQDELQAQMDREEQRLRDLEFEALHSSNDSGVNWINVIEHAGQAMTELNQLQRQINQENRQMALEAERIRNQRQAEVWQRERQQAAERQQAMDRQRRVQEQQQREREAELQRLQQQQASRQRAMEQQLAQRQAQQQAALQRAASQRRDTGAAAGNGATPVASSRGLQKVYEPNMVTATGRSTAGFSSREQTEELALLNGINQVHRMCQEKGARVDTVPNDMLRNKTAPPRWNFGAPRCRQGGWQGKEWFCDTPVSGTCYRMQSFSSP